MDRLIQRRALPRAGFTFVELMVALAIVAVLFVAGFGAYRLIVDKMGVGGSVSNIRQLALANLAYAADHNGSYCPAQSPDNMKRWHGGREGASEEFDPALGYLASYIGVDRRQIMCPLLRKLVPDASSWEKGSGGYGYNAAYIGGTVGDPFTPASQQDISVAARTIMFTTSALAMENGLQEYPFAEPFFWSTGSGGNGGDLQPSVHFRALGKAIVAWCDGHSSLEHPSKFEDINFYGGDNRAARIGWFGPADQNGFWNPRSPAVVKMEDPTAGQPPAKP